VTIDVHAHYLPRSVVVAADSGRDWHGIRFEQTSAGHLVSTTPERRFALPWPDFRAPVDARIADMDRIGVDLQILSLTPTLWRHEVDAADGTAMARDVNDETASIVAAHPGRFAGYAFLPLQDAAAAVSELERAVRDLGLVGASVATNVLGEDWDSARLFPVLEAAHALDALLFVHPTAVRPREVLNRYHLGNLIGNPWETTVAIGSIVFGGVLDRLPGLKLCFAHGGGYATFAIGRFDHGYRVRPESQARAKHVPSDYLRLLLYDSLTHSERALRHIADLVGVDHVVLGSDYPADMGYDDPVGWLRGLTSFTRAEKEQIEGENINRLLRLSRARVAIEGAVGG
jgi:aminocarboxymuconate-semialdehyde decarboxylase